jgi:hypothetical protein
MAISAEQLNVILSARDREFTRAMERSQRQVERFAKQTNQSLLSVSGIVQGNGYGCKNVPTCAICWRYYLASATRRF